MDYSDPREDSESSDDTESSESTEQLSEDDADGPPPLHLTAPDLVRSGAELPLLLQVLLSDDPVGTYTASDPADDAMFRREPEKRARDNDPNVQKWRHFATNPLYAEYFRHQGRLTAGLPAHDTLVLSDSWKFRLDNTFAHGIFQSLDSNGRSPHKDVDSHHFCSSCRTMSILRKDFQLVFRISELQQRAGSCSLCNLMSNALEPFTQNLPGDGTVVVERAGSILTVANKPVLRICTRPGPLAEDNEIQIGLPVLPQAGSESHFKIIRGWLEDCDTIHSQHRCSPRQDSFLPSRVLDLGFRDKLHLYETSPGEKGRYVTLSHRWGDPKEHKQFSNHCCNIDTLRAKIDLEELPRTFQNAVATTRAIGVRYLWIDSLCIIQPHEGCTSACSSMDDWIKEAPRMGQYYSSAYCTIAATSATGSSDGFLNPRRERPHLRLPQPRKSALYLCDAIDNFHRDVDEGDLNQRGWVLQERILSGRTIHFTDTQTYWECGIGVRCETLTRMENNKASILGDPQFPSYFSERMHTDCVRLFQILFERYSTLALTVGADRPVAISAITQRLSHSFETEETYGIFRRYAASSLLWKAASKVTKIKVKSGRKRVPSWSWMAYEGEIKYLQVSDTHIEWNNVASHLISGSEVPARELTFSSGGLVRESTTVGTSYYNVESWEFDQAGKNVDTKALRVIVVGRERKQHAWGAQNWTAPNWGAQAGGAQDDYRYYVLVVAPVPSGQAYNMYQRVGIGVLGGSPFAGATHMVRVI